MTMLKEVKRLYLSGKMSGLSDLGFGLFNRTAAQLRAIGYEVVNPAEINSDPAADWLECIKVDLDYLATCDGIALLPNWSDSFGAKIEHLAAQKLGLAVLNVEDLVTLEAA
ncbi:hypothetical protein J2801_003598 [Paraburkholderia phenoliruptrix]|nr:hypothetical protein [Paraburkholderia phenoliruptrix]MDR6421310.1 hypothetical protein [Paraburkholderia phenoliruptrix]